MSGIRQGVLNATIHTRMRQPYGVRCGEVMVPRRRSAKEASAVGTLAVRVCIRSDREGGYRGCARPSRASAGSARTCAPAAARSGANTRSSARAWPGRSCSRLARPRGVTTCPLSRRASIVSRRRLRPHGAGAERPRPQIPPVCSHAPCTTWPLSLSPPPGRADPPGRMMTGRRPGK